MNNETLKRDLCARLMDGVKVRYKRKVWDIRGIRNLHVKRYLCVDLISIQTTDGNFIEKVKPYLFPTSALTKPIQLANYNNGEPFVPIVEMAKMLGWNVEKCLLKCNEETGAFGIMCDANYRLMDEDVQDVLAFTINSGFGWHSRPSKDFHVVLKQSELWDLMHKFHINYRLSPDQFIEVTEEFNPYK